MPETIIQDTSEYTVWEDIRPNARTVRIEFKAGSQGANRETLETRAQQALTANGTYLALPTPTAAQNTAQLQRVTRECSALIRLLLSRLEDVSDT